MKRTRALTAVTVALMLGACSDSSSITAPDAPLLDNGGSIGSGGKDGSGTTTSTGTTGTEACYLLSNGGSIGSGGYIAVPCEP